MSILKLSQNKFWFFGGGKPGQANLLDFACLRFKGVACSLVSPGPSRLIKLGGGFREPGLIVFIGAGFGFFSIDVVLDDISIIKNGSIDASQNNGAEMDRMFHQPGHFLNRIHLILQVHFLFLYFAFGVDEHIRGAHEQVIHVDIKLAGEPDKEFRAGIALAVFDHWLRHSWRQPCPFAVFAFSYVLLLSFAQFP